MRNRLIVCVAIVLACGLAACQQTPTQEVDQGARGTEETGMAQGGPSATVEHDGITLELDGEMHFRLGPPSGESIVVDGWTEVESGREAASGFAVAGDAVIEEEVTTDLGQARRLTVEGVAILSGGARLSRTLTVDTYPQWPDALFLQARYVNLSDDDVILDRVTDVALQMDSSRTDPALQPNELWSFQGASVEWGQDLAFEMPSFFARDNYLGLVEGGEGGGIPVVYTWNRQLGVALAHVEPTPRLWHMPVTGGSRNGVRVALEYREPVAVPPGGQFEGLRTMLSVHNGDFYGPLALYASVLAAQGLQPAQPNAEDYAVPWCSWGYEFDVRPDEMLGVVPKLQEMDIHWATLDDRWFDNYGDWNPRADTIGSEEEMRAMVDALHEAGVYAQIWWYPLAVEDGVGGYESHRYVVADVVQEHPDWLCRHADGSVARNNRGLAILDPAIPGVQEYVVDLTRRFVEDWGFDGHKLDNVYFVPPCHGSAYHERPEDSVDAFAEVYRLIHETTRALKPHSVTQICPCGTPPTFSLLPYFDQAVTADPTSSLQVRRRIKFYKALLGPRAAVFADHVELSDGGMDFASAVGTGGIPGTKFVWPEDEALRGRLDEWNGLDAGKEALWKEWLALYDEHRLAEGEYLDLYDLAYDVPEGHAIRKDDVLYYAFYTPRADDSFEGSVELRGLEARAYRLADYVNGQDMGAIEGPVATLQVAFEGSLLLQAVPE